MKRLLQTLLVVGLFVNPTGSRDLAGDRLSPAPSRANPRPDTPSSLTFDELVTLSNTDEPAPELMAKLNSVLQTVALNNDFAAGGHQTQLTDPKIGPALRVAFWNIERGIQLDLIKQALTEPEKFEQAVDSGKKRKDSERAKIRDQAETLRRADILLLNEVDLGMKRTDYRDVGRELAQAAGMNYVYGVEFIEVDALVDLGIEDAHLEEPDLDKRMDEDLKADSAQYRGLHGNAILSRYPIEQASIVRLPVCHDWYADEKKEISKLEQGKRLAADKIFLERIGREVRRGGRMAIVADLAVPESPSGVVTLVDAHLENKCKPACRRKQMAALLETLRDVHNPLILAGDMNTTGKDGSPTSVRAEFIRLVKDYEFWVKQAVNWFTPLSLPSYAVMPFQFWRTYRDPTATHIPFFGSNQEAALFRDLRKFRFADGNTVDFRGMKSHTDAKTGTLANSNQRAWKGFTPTFAMPRDFGGVMRLKLDWFFIKPLVTTGGKNGRSKEYHFDPYFPRSMNELNGSVAEGLSDHAPLTVDLALKAAATKQR